VVHMWIFINLHESHLADVLLFFQTNEKLVNRIRHVKKVLRKYKKLRRFASYWT